MKRKISIVLTLMLVLVHFAYMPVIVIAQHSSTNDKSVDIAIMLPADIDTWSQARIIPQFEYEKLEREYKVILDACYKFSIGEGFDNDFRMQYENFCNDLEFTGTYDDFQSDFWYLFCDIDSNGTAELVLHYADYDSIFALNGDKPVYVISGYYRTTLGIGNTGVIHDEGSMGWQDGGGGFYRLKSDGCTLQKLYNEVYEDDRVLETPDINEGLYDRDFDTIHELTNKRGNPYLYLITDLAENDYILDENEFAQFSHELMGGYIDCSNPTTIGMYRMKARVPTVIPTLTQLCLFAEMSYFPFSFSELNNGSSANDIAKRLYTDKNQRDQRELFTKFHRDVIQNNVIDKKYMDFYENTNGWHYYTNKYFELSDKGRTCFVILSVYVKEDTIVLAFGGNNDLSWWNLLNPIEDKFLGKRRIITRWQ